MQQQLFWLLVWQVCLCLPICLVFSISLEKQSKLLSPSLGPSREYLSPNRRVSTRAVDWCEGRMLPLQRYRSFRAKIDLSLEQKASSLSSGSNLPPNNCVTDVTTKAPDNEAFLKHVIDNPESFNLSKTSQSTMESYNSLSLDQKEHLVQKIRVEQQASQEVPLEALEILYCDAHICVTNKPSGVLSVPGPRRNPSLANLVYETLQPDIDLDQMVVHRLDMATSGIIVYALSLKALSKLHLDFKERRVQKTYEALVIPGMPSSFANEGDVDVQLERDPNNPPFMRIAQPKPDVTEVSENNESPVGKLGPTHKFYTQAPKESLTTWSLLSTETYMGRPVARLELRPWTGRTHQLRVHCAQALNSPIVGDDIYGSIKASSTETGAQSPLCLHAKKLCIYHPISGASMIFEADPPF